ncbi:MAG: carboxypeptidase M32 [Nanohaloarchaea archaeon]|nr:carboxypeptidase M32 [Candidatus Nanohaloarchaea archaeon]
MSYEEFEKEVKVLGNLEEAVGVLGWDEEVMMPEKGLEARSKQKSVLTKLRHEKLVSERLGELLESIDRRDLDKSQKANVREIERERERMKSVSADLMEKMSQKESEAVNAWKKAKKEDNYELFAEELRELVELKRRYANQINPDEEPYKVLFKDYEPYIGYETMEKVLKNLKKGLVPIVEKISEAEDIEQNAFKGDFEDEEEMELNHELAELLGFDKKNGRLDCSEHPFTSGNTFDTRITTRIEQGDLSGSLMPTIHELGHALYQLGLPEGDYATPRGGARELSVHESQSRLWENQVGRSKEFWKFMLPKLEERFPEKFEEISIQDCYESINQVYEDNMIRVKADELTYHLHIVLRFEIGRALMNGEIEVEDLPEEWNKRMEKYLGLEPETDSEGVMQDIHWAWGNFGYFPTYSLGSVLATQIYREAEEEVEGLEKKIESGEFEDLRDWLKTHIHSKGRLLKTEELIEKVTNEPINSEPFLNYIRGKYGEIYNLELEN